MPSAAEEEVIHELLTFLEVAIHGVLYMRRGYPEPIFERRHKYEVPVFMSRHPDLNLYIREVLESASGMLHEESIDKFIVCFYDHVAEPMETFSFEVGDSARLIKELAQGQLDPQPIFRKMLARITVADQIAELPPLPEDATFALLLSTKPNAAVAGGGEAAAAGTTPEEWMKVVSSGQYAPAGPESYLGTSSSSNGSISYLNLVSWEAAGGGGGGRGGGREKYMRLTVRSRRREGGMEVEQGGGAGR